MPLFGKRMVSLSVLLLAGVFGSVSASPLEAGGEASAPDASSTSAAAVQGASAATPSQLDGWPEVYANAAGGGRIEGDKEALLEAVRAGRRIGVRWISFHGELVGTCKQATADLDGRIECQVEVWCDQEYGAVPRQHGHRSKVTSGGRARSMVLASRAGETRIVAVGDGTSSVRWYVEAPNAATVSMAGRP